MTSDCSTKTLKWSPELINVISSWELLKLNCYLFPFSNAMQKTYLTFIKYLKLFIFGTCIPMVGAAVMLRPRLIKVSDGVTTEKRNPPCWSEGLKEVTIAKFSNIESGSKRECGVRRSDPARKPNAGKPWRP